MSWSFSLKSVCMMCAEGHTESKTPTDRTLEKVTLEQSTL